MNKVSKEAQNRYDYRVRTIDDETLIVCNVSDCSYCEAMNAFTFMDNMGEVIANISRDFVMSVSRDYCVLKDQQKQPSN